MTVTVIGTITILTSDVDEYYHDEWFMLRTNYLPAMIYS